MHKGIDGVAANTIQNGTKAMTGIHMRGTYRICGAMLVLLGLTAGANARTYCARAKEITALKTAAMQQELMVAALTCHQADLYNRFVTGHRTALRRSDRVLRHYFARHGGMAAYHTYKTHLANTASLASIHDNKGYCARTRAMFHDALYTDNATLALLVADHPAEGAVPCGHRMRMARRPK